MTDSVLVTGAHGFIGRNLVVSLREKGVLIYEATSATTESELRELVAKAGSVVHLAGVNRPANPEDHALVNAGFTQRLVTVLGEVNPVPLVFASSTQATLDNDYGRSKRRAEDIVHDYAKRFAQKVSVVRLPSIFGKWCRPNYNSVVATFVHNVSRGLPLRLDDPAHVLQLAYIDDVVELLCGVLDQSIYVDDPRPEPIYRITVGQLAETLTAIHSGRTSNRVLDVGAGLKRALYATYVSALDPEDFSYQLVPHADHRGSFTEVLRTPAAGQISFLTAVPGATRGSHYHHSKIEKFVVVSGSARFRFRCLATGRQHQVNADSRHPVVVESIPGWIHDVTNTGGDELVVLVWANEVFDPVRPDTFAEEV